METHATPVNPIPQKVLDRLRLRLEHERVRLLEAIDKAQRLPERVEGDPAGDDVDVAERLGEPDADVGERLRHQYESTLRAVQGAIERMESGAYGINARTGEVIPIERLEAVPWATE